MANRPPSGNGSNGINGRISVPVWLFIVIVLTAAAPNMARVFLSTGAVCP